MTRRNNQELDFFNTHDSLQLNNYALRIDVREKTSIYDMAWIPFILPDQKNT